MRTPCRFSSACTRPMSTLLEGTPSRSDTAAATPALGRAADRPGLFRGFSFVSPAVLYTPSVYTAAAGGAGVFFEKYAVGEDRGSVIGVMTFFA